MIVIKTLDGQDIDGDENAITQIAGPSAACWGRRMVLETPPLA